MTGIGTVFLSGAITLGFLAAALFFLRFWKRTKDRLFLAFAMAFGLLSLNQALIVFVPMEERSWLYLLRLLAFAIILTEIWAKNRKR